MTKESISVRIRGQEFRIRSGEDEESLRRVARYLEETMASVGEQTGTVDSLSVALLTALNLAREVLEMRDGGIEPEARDGGIETGGDPERLRALIELAEAALESPAARA